MWQDQNPKTIVILQYTFLEFLIFKLVSLGQFSEYDYGPVKNMKIYGSEEPPEYNISKITTPVALFYAKNDKFVSISVSRILCR